ncbi:MAG: hypothetical protein V7731_13395 [Amphritea sp.]
MILKRGFIVSLIGAAALLSGCSGHPGTGSWQAAGENSGHFTSLEVAFDGKAQLIKTALSSTGNADKTLRCLWQATSKENLQLQCREAAQPDTTLQYTLHIMAENTAVLYQKEQVIARFNR